MRRGGRGRGRAGAGGGRGLGLGLGLHPGAGGAAPPAPRAGRDGGVALVLHVCKDGQGLVRGMWNRHKR